MNLKWHIIVIIYSHSRKILNLLLVLTRLFEYKNNVLTKDYIDSEFLSTMTIYNNDKNGNIIEEVHYNDLTEDVVFSRITYSYDEKAVLKYSNYKIMDQQGRVEYFIDEKSRYIKESWLDIDGYEFRVIKNKYLNDLIIELIILMFF